MGTQTNGRRSWYAQNPKPQGTNVASGKQAGSEPGFVAIINPSNLLVSKDVPGNNIKFTL